LRGFITLGSPAPTVAEVWAVGAVAGGGRPVSPGIAGACSIPLERSRNGYS
jgi:hypothetical protein